MGEYLFIIAFTVFIASLFAVVIQSVNYKPKEETETWYVITATATAVR